MRCPATEAGKILC